LKRHTPDFGELTLDLADLRTFPRNRRPFTPIFRVSAIMDKFDAHILNVLQQSARTTAEAMSQQVGLSPDACRKRMARLRSSGIIKAEIAVLDPASVGLGLILIVEVTLKNKRKADLDRFKAAIQSAPDDRITVLYRHGAVPSPWTGHS